MSAPLPQHMGHDQHGTTYHALGPHPRKELMARLGRKHASRMYVDRSDGRTVHIGWVIANRWIAVYRVIPLERDP
jgi:hypothetical protein